jgi:hypothetical protein
MKRARLTAMTFGLMGVLLMLPTSFARATLENGTPELVTNGIRTTEMRVEVVNYGQILLKSAQLPGSEIECVNLAFGAFANEGTPLRIHGQILTWTANGHLPEFPHTELGSKCRGLSGSGWAVDEPPLTAGARGAKVSTPWNVVGFCGEREEVRTAILQFGYPNGEEPLAHRCLTQIEEESVAASERTERKNCFQVLEGKGEPEPEGCVNLTIVDPTAALEIRYGGSLRPTWSNGAGNGLDASRWHWQGAPWDELRCELAACEAPATVTGSVKAVGFEAQQLIQVR